MRFTVIISASYRTDIPAFYGTWLMQRLAAGSCRSVNPWNRKPYEVSLAPAAVDGFVFWTRNLIPFAKHLPAIAARAPFYVQYTVTGYPHALERSVIPMSRAVDSIRETAARFGPRTVVWRYDPIVFTDLTPADWHLENFARIAEQLAGHVDEVTVSFAHIYRKTRRNMNAAAARSGFRWSDPEPDEKTNLIAALAENAATRGIALTVCSQPAFVAPAGRPAACIDVRRLEAMSGVPISAPIKGNRPGCLCHQARDIGAYDTCPHGCAYCYAVSDPARAKAHHGAHAPQSDIL